MRTSLGARGKATAVLFTGARSTQRHNAHVAHIAPFAGTPCWTSSIRLAVLVYLTSLFKGCVARFALHGLS